MVDSVNNNGNVDLTRWRRLTPQEILKEEGRGEEIPSEIISWAQQMITYTNMPDDVTYEMVDGDVGVEALDKLGIEEEPPVSLEDNNSAGEVEIEEPEAVRETDRPEGDNDVDMFSPEDTDIQNNEDFSLADSELTADLNEMRKRKERKGMLP